MLCFTQVNNTKLVVRVLKGYVTVLSFTQVNNTKLVVRVLKGYVTVTSFAQVNNMKLLCVSSEVTLRCCPSHR